LITVLFNFLKIKSEKKIKIDVSKSIVKIGSILVNIFRNLYSKSFEIITDRVIADGPTTRGIEIGNTAKLLMFFS
tara:strand:+ start:1051 stop:1275 length:225 start_codon:yes stop_codon:yes gene_type:complete